MASTTASPASAAAEALLLGGAKGGLVPSTEANNKISVAIRVRPFTPEEERGERSVSQGVVVDGTQIQVNGKDGRAQRTYAFDHCFDSTFRGSKTGSQEYLFETVGRKVLTDAWEGFHTSVFAYGQTGSGKTHTMLGGDKPGEEGLLPRIGRELVKSIEEAKYQNSRKKKATGSGVPKASYGGYHSGSDEDEGSRRSSTSSDSEYGVKGAHEAAAEAEGEEEDLVTFELKASYVELYNEKFYDLLSKTPTKEDVLKLREDPKTGAFLQGATWEAVHNWPDMQRILEKGKAARRTATTKMNEMSSRSHAIFMLEFRQMTNNRSLLPHTSATASSNGMPEDAAVARVSQICLVDLAGSERRDKSGIVDAVRAKESSTINLSLVCLGKVLNALANQGPNGGKENSGDSPLKGGSPFKAGGSPSKKDSFINYRESMLTRLLKESLGGNAKTVMLATVAPSHAQMSESMSTLGYANSAKNIFTHPHINEDPKDRVIRQLMEENRSLRDQMLAAAKGGDVSTPPQHSPLTSVVSKNRGGHPQRSPVLKVDGKEQQQGFQEDARQRLSSYSTVGSDSLDEEDSARQLEDDDLAPSTSGSLTGGLTGHHLRSKSAVSDKQPGGNSSTHGRKPSEVARLPRLAKSLATQGAGLPAPAVGHPLPSTTTTKRIISPETTTTTATAHTLGVPGAAGASSYYTTAHTSLAEVREMRARFLNVESEICSQTVKSLANEGDASMLSEKVLAALPLVIEANSLAQASNKPVAFYLDILPRPVAQPTLHLEQTLLAAGHAALAEAMGLKQLAAAPAPALLPSLLEAADLVPTVMVRARGALNDSICDLSVEEFKEALKAMHEARARPDGRMPLLQGGGHHQHHDSLDSPPAALAASSMGSAETASSDAFLFAGQDSLLGRSDVYLSALLDNRNVLGAFPLLNGVDGGCIGAVKLRLLPQSELSSTPTLGTEKSYTLKLELDSLDIDKAALGQLGLGGAWNSNPVSTANPALRYPDEACPGLVLRYGFWPSEACGEVELSPHSSKVREMVARGTPESVCYPIAHQATLNVEAITPSFLTYLATGALRITLHMTRDPTETELWSRHQGLPQVPTERCQALSLVHSTDPVAPLPAFMDGGEEEAASEVGGGRRRPRPITTDIPDHEVEEGDTFSVMGTLAPPGAFDTCSRMSMRNSGRMSVRRSQSTKHAAHFYENQHSDTACFLFMGVDVLEPILEPGIDYFNELPTKYTPVDIKPISSFKRRYYGRGGAIPNPSAMQQGGMDDDCVSEMGDAWDGSDMGSVMGSSYAGTAATGRWTAPKLVDRTSGANAVFHVMANPLIRMRQMKLVIEQVGPLAGPMLLESCLHVRASSYLSLNERDYTGDIREHTQCSTDLNILRVNRTACKRRLEVTVEMPGCQILYEKCPRGERVILALEVAVFIEGAAQPVIIPRNIIMKVLPPERHQSMFYNLKKSLKEPLSDRVHRIGTYYAVKASSGPHLRETVADFVQYKLGAHRQLLTRMEKARVLQEGSGSGSGKKAQPDLASFEAWNEALVAEGKRKKPLLSPTKKKDVTRGMDALGLGEEDSSSASSEEDEDPLHARHQHLSTMAMNVEERKAVASALFGVDLTVQRAAKGGAPIRAPNGVYYMDSIPATETRPVTYVYPARGMGDHTMREQERNWDALSRMWVEEVPDFPTTREGFLNMRTGLLNASSTRLWFVWRRPFLFIYKAKPAAGSSAYQAPQDVINVTDCHLTLDPVDELGFEIKGPSKHWSLQANTEDDLTNWLLAFHQPVRNLPEGAPEELRRLTNGSVASSRAMPPLLTYPGSSGASVASVSTRASFYQGNPHHGAAQHLRAPSRQSQFHRGGIF